MPAERDWLLVSEEFSTLQGEGPSSGQPAHFVRLGGCNLHCHWCDTPYTWSFDERHALMHDSKVQYNPARELKRRPIAVVANAILDSDTDLCVITGGEPLLQQEQIARLISTVNEEANVRFEIETAGTIAPTSLEVFENVHYNVSPKLAGSGNAPELRLQPKAIRSLQLAKSLLFKFVITDQYDLMEVEAFVNTYSVPAKQVWLMPEGTTSEKIQEGLKLLAPTAIANGWNLTSRMHVMIWGSERGR